MSETDAWICCLLFFAEARRLPDILRVSLHVYNTVEEIGFFVEELARIAATARVVAIEK